MLKLEIRLFFTVLLLTISFVPQPASGTRPAHVLGSEVVGKPVSSGSVVSWLQREPDSPLLTLHAYDHTSQAAIIVKRDLPAVEGLATDGRTLAWIERAESGTVRIQGYDLAERQEWTIVTGTGDQQFGGIALTDGALYYHDTRATHPGLYARNIYTGREQLLSATGRDPVAAGGVLLWSEVHTDPLTDVREWRLYLHNLHGQSNAKLLARTSTPFSAYHAAGDAVVWSALPPAVDERVYRYRISDETTVPISTAAGRYPVATDKQAIWLGQPETEPAQRLSWSLEAYNLNNGQQQTLTHDLSGPLIPWALLDAETLVVSKPDPRDAGVQQLFLAKLTQPHLGLEPAAQAMTTANASTRNLCRIPLDCGQVYARGAALYDAGGPWHVNGVQFFLPQFGINTWTFYDRNYWNSLDDINRWLSIAQTELHAKTLRIYVELPTQGTTPTSHRTIYDFAQRANAHGMRLGLVLQNSSDFAMTTERAAWLDGLVTYFQARQARTLIAYVSAANEINNMCNRDDCYDQRQSYIDAANGWVAAFTAIFKQRQSGILTTVGISTEVRDTDGLPASYNFFKPDAQGRTLSSLVDFLAPHNYAGGAYGVIDELRYARGYTGPIVLEEYGWSTDPRAQDARFVEGAASCRSAPWSSQCRDTAPYFIEWSLRALHETTYAGGVAWMLADVEHKRCGSDPGDLWTGLYAAGTGYCGGTLTVIPYKAKATATRVALHYHADVPYITHLPIVSHRR